MNRKITNLVLSLLLFIQPLGLGKVFAQFFDTPGNAWYQEAVEYGVEQKYIQGYPDGSFRPGAPVNRAEFVKMVVNSLELPYYGCDVSLYRDVPESWYCPPITTGTYQGIVNGVQGANGSLQQFFAPAQIVSRAEAAAIISRAFSLEKEKTSPQANYSDVSSNAWYSPYVNQVTDWEIMEGYNNNTFKPANALNRAEAATVLYNAILITTGEVPDDDDDDDDGDDDDDDDDDQEPISGDLEVQKIADQGARNVPKGSLTVPMLNFRLTADTDENIQIDELTFKRTGAGTRSDIESVSLYQNDQRITAGRSINADHEVEFFNLRITLQKGQSTNLSLRADINPNAQASNQHAFALQNKADIDTTAENISGTFPITGSTITIAGVSAGEVTISKQGSISNPAAGAQDQKISQFQIEADDETVTLQQISLTLGGSIDTSDIGDFKLVQGSNTLAQVSEANRQDLIVLKLTQPLRLEEGSTRSFSVTADIKTSADPGDTIQIYLEEESDLIAVGQTYNQNVRVVNTNFNQNNASTSQLQGADIRLTINRNTQNSASLNSDNVNLLSFNLDNGSSNVEVREMTFRIYAASRTAFGNNGGLYNDALNRGNIQDIRLVNLDTGRTVFGPDEITSTSTQTVATPDSPYTAQEYIEIIFRDGFDVDAGEDIDLALQVDIDSNAQSGNVLWGELRPISTTSGIRNVENNQYITNIIPTSSITGNKITLESSNVQASLASTPSSQSFVKGSRDVPVLGFILEAGNASDMTINSLTLTTHLDENTDNVYDNGGTPGYDNGRRINEIITFVNLYDTQGNKINNNTETVDSSGKVTFDDLNFDIEAGRNEKITVKVDISNNGYMNGNPDRFSFDIANPDQDISATDEFFNEVSLGTTPLNGGTTPIVRITVISSGTIIAQAYTSQQTAEVVTDNTNNILAGTFRLYPQNEDFNVETLTFKNTGNNNSAIRTVTLKYPTDINNPANLNGTATTFVRSSGLIEFTNLDMEIPKNESTTFQVFVDTNEIVFNQGGVQTGDIIRINFTDDANARFEAFGDSGEIVEDISTLGLPSGGLLGTELIVRNSIPIVSVLNVNSNDRLAFSPESEIFKFRVAASDKGDAGIKKVSFEVFHSGIRQGPTGINQANGFKLYNYSVDTNNAIATGTLTGNTVTFTFNEQTINRNTDSLFVIKAPIFDDTTQDSYTLSTRFKTDSNANADATNNDNTGTFTEVNVGTNYFIWSDHSAPAHSDTTVDWTNGYELPIPTSTYNLS